MESNTSLASNVSGVDQMTATMPIWMLEAIRAHHSLTSESMSGLVRRGLHALAREDDQWGAVLNAYSPTIADVVKKP